MLLSGKQLLKEVYMLRLTTCLMTAFVLSLTLSIFANPANDESTIESYIEQYKDIAVEEMMRADIPASIKLAQAILESNAGRSHLAVHGNNHFGIKCGKYWDGATIMREDDDYVKNKLVKSCFRSYPSAEFSFRAHTDFLTDPKKAYRYGLLFELSETDYVGWARGLKKAGYATNPKYANQLITIIERYQLHLYDNPPVVAVHEEIIAEDVAAYEDRISKNVETVPAQPGLPEHEPTSQREGKSKDFFAGTSSSYQTHEINSVKYIITEYGDNLESIALEMGSSVKDLQCFNEFGYDAHQALTPKTIIYIEPKKNSYRGKRATYRINKGESLFDVSQKFGMKLNKLLKRNKWDKSYQPNGGQLVYLRGKRK